jgi:hypothetical protein
MATKLENLRAVTSIQERRAQHRISFSRPRLRRWSERSQLGADRSAELGRLTGARI